MSNKNKTARRLAGIAMASAFVIGLSSCSGAGNNYGKLTDNTYASVTTSDGTNVSVSEKELWDELRWNAKGVLDTKVEDVIVNKYVEKIRLVMDAKTEFDKVNGATDDAKFEGLSADTKTKLKDSLDITTGTAYVKLYKSYAKDLINIVVKDVYNFNYSEDNTYIDDIEKFDKATTLNNRLSYADELFSNYQIETINGKTVSELLISALDDENLYLEFANNSKLKSLYYKEFANRLFAIACFREDIEEAYEDDDDDEDDTYGYYTKSKLITKFKNVYTGLNDINAVLIKFSTETEFTNTLRAFGLKFYSGKLYFIGSDDSITTYQDYITYYNDFSSTKLGVNEFNSYTVESSPALELFVQIYNYMYGGYRDTLSTGVKDSKGKEFDVANYDLNTLRSLTSEILAVYTSQNKTKYNEAVTALAKFDNADSTTKTRYTAKELYDLDSSLKSYLYTTLDDSVPAKRYSTSTQSANSGYYIAYKFDSIEFDADADGNPSEYTKNVAAKYDLEAKDVLKYAKFYAADLTDTEIWNFILETDGLLRDLEDRCVIDDLGETKITSYITEAKEDVNVSIYDEAVEIAYGIANSGYSKTVFGNGDKNVLATIKYDDKEYNLNIVANSEDTKALTWLGTDEAFGVYNYLEASSGATTATDQIAKKIIKTTNAYKKTNEDRELYNNAIKYILLNFANGGYESNGYAATIGKYNFLMMYFHSANIDNIIDDYYRVQYASIKLLTDYNNDTLINFFKEYVDEIYDTYFSVTATRLVVYFDANEDNEADKVSDWAYKTVTDKTSEFYGKTWEYVAKSLIYEVYNKMSASTSEHATYLTTVVDEINQTAKVVYEDNPIASENIWAKYRHLGLLVKTEEVTATNSTTTIDFNIKERLYAYATGNGSIKTYTGTGANKTVASTKAVKYQYFINDTTPTAYIEPLDESAISTENNYIVESTDGYNLFLVTAGTAKASAEWKADDNDEGILNKIVVHYNDKDYVIDGIFNDDKKLTTNQIKAYILDYAANGSSTLMPASLADAFTAFLSPVYSRYTSSETQRIILLSFLRNKTGNTSTELYDVVKFANTSYNGADGVFNKIINIDQTSADGYVSIYTDKDSEFYDPTETVNQYNNWWTKINSIINNLLLEDTKEEK